MASINGLRPALAAPERVGTAFSVFSSLCYGSSPIFVRWAYEAGAVPLTLLAFRYVVATLVLLAALRLAGRPLAMPRAQRFAGIVAGLFFSVMAYGYLFAIQRIPVSLAALLVFTYPLPLALLGRLRGEPLKPARIIAMAAAFVGLAVALGVEIGELDLLGIVSATVCSLTYAFSVFYFGDTTRGADPLVVILHATATAGLIFVPLALLDGSWSLIPSTALGLTGVVGVALTYLAGVFFFFAALVRIGPMKTALLAQLEPVVSILSAVLILGEQLSLVQSVGIAVVLGALATLAR
ncbi:MAG TPA: DMT family transporter [Stellaceae bacterium]|nr:DMT family transporter [Stellaceae bacterium]